MIVMPLILVLTGGKQFADLQADFCYTATVLAFGYTGITLSRKLSHPHRPHRGPTLRVILTFSSDQDVSPSVGYSPKLVRCCIFEGLYRLIF